MLNSQFLDDEDFKISYNDALSAIRLLFNDKIQECSENYPNSEFIEALKGMREEFLDSFKMTLNEITHKKI